MKPSHGIILSILLFPFFASAQVTGWDIVAHSFGSIEYSNITLHSLDGDTLKFDVLKADRQIFLDSVISLSKKKGPNTTLRSVALGSLGLGVGGFFIGTLISSDNNASSVDQSTTKVAMTIGGLLIGGGIGAALAPKRDESTIILPSMSMEEKRKAIVSLFSGTSPAFAAKGKQSNGEEQDIVQLKNGSVVRGNVMEVIPDSIVKLQGADGTPLVFKTSELATITKEPVERPLVRQGGTTPLREPQFPEMPIDHHPHISLSLGGGIPLGDYADGVEAGLGLRGDIIVPLEGTLGWTGSVSASFNGLKSETSGDVSLDVGSLSSVFALTGLCIGPNFDRSFSPYLHAQIGVVFATFPEMKFSYGGMTASTESSKSTAFGYGIGGGVVIAGRLNIGLNYMHANPEFTVEGGKFEAPVSLMLLTAGVTF